MVDRPPQPADDDSIKAQPRRFSWGQVGALGLLVLLLLACVLWIPNRLYPSLTDTDLKDIRTQNAPDYAKIQELKDARLKLQSDTRTTLLQGLGALLVLTGAAIGASVTLRQVQATRDQIAGTAKASQDQLKLSNDQLRLNEQGQVTDRYTKAIDQLNDDKALAVRLGGLYALERIAYDSPANGATIAEVLCSYARTARRRPAENANPPVTDTAPVGKPSVVVSLTIRAPDVQAAVTILGRWQDRLGQPPPVLDLHNADLQGARLDGAQLQDANLAGAQLQRADLAGAQLQRANLAGAQLQGANLAGAQLEDANLAGAQLQGANLYDAQLQDAKLSGAQLQDAKLYDAQGEVHFDSNTVWPERKAHQFGAIAVGKAPISDLLSRRRPNSAGPGSTRPTSTRPESAGPGSTGP
jgi:hypothetical protein